MCTEHLHSSALLIIYQSIPKVIWACEVPAAGETGESPTEQTKQDRMHTDGKEGRNWNSEFGSWDKFSTGLLSFFFFLITYRSIS